MWQSAWDASRRWPTSKPAVAGPVLPATVPGPVLPASPAAAAAPDPRDSSYWGGVTNLDAERKSKLADLDTSDTYARQDADDSTRRLVEQHAKNLMGAKQGANARNLFYSTFLTNENTGLEKQKAEGESAIGEALRRQLGGNQTARDEIARLYGDGSAENHGQKGLDLFNEAIARGLAASMDREPEDVEPSAAPAAGAVKYTPAQELAALRASVAKDKARTRHDLAIAEARKRPRGGNHGKKKGR